MNTLEDKVGQLKQLVKDEWAGDETAAAWRKYYPAMKESLAEVTSAIVEAAAPKSGESVLDLASGTGEPALSLAKRVAPGGMVMATDLSGAMLAVLRENASSEGVANVTTQVVDAHELPFEDGSFDLVTSRFGVMFFIEIERALAEVRRVLKPGGRIAFLVWGEPRPGTYFGAAVAPFMKRLPEKPPADAPTPVRFAEPGKLLKLVEAAGFNEVTETIGTYANRWKGSPEDLFSSMMEIAAPFRAMAESFPPDQRSEAEEEVYANLRPLYDGTFTTTQAPVIIVTGCVD